MNILFLTNHLNVGGITSYVLTLAKGLQRRGHTVYVASSAGGEALPRFLDEQIPVIPIPIRTKNELSPKILHSKWKLLRLLKTGQQIDIIHSHSRTTQVLGCALSRKTGIPHVFTCHGFFKRRFSRIVHPCWGRMVIAISDSVRQHLVQDFKVKPDMVRVVYNGIDLGRFRAPDPRLRIERRKDFGLNSGPVVGNIARLSDVKGHVYLIEAMPMVRKRVPDAQLLIVGDGKMQKRLQSRIRAWGLQKNVVLIPTIKDTWEALCAMDIFVMPSLQEGLGLALMEAMACGLAVIGSRIGGIPDLIHDGHNGRLVAPADSRGIADSIIDLLGDPELRKRLGTNARSFVSQNFSYEKMAAQTEGVYEECVKKAS